MRAPERRELDYVRQTAASVETAKEVKIFGLNAFLMARYEELARSFFRANRKIAVRRAWWLAILSAVATSAYYTAYAYIAWRTLHGEFSIGDLTFLAGSFLRLRGLIEGFLTGLSSVAGQALYLDDLFSFFEIKPEITSPANPRPFPNPIREGFTFDDVGFRYPGAEHWAVRHLSFTLRAGEVLALVGEKRRGQDHAREARDAPLRPRRGPHPPRRPRPARVRPLRAAREHRRHLPGLRALPPHRGGEHRGRADRGPRRP
jgi:ATP-binding cassette subfamily B protein